MSGVGARCERKYVISGQSRHQVISLLKQHPAGFKPIYHPRKINSLYFDTPEWEFFFDNVEGATDRQKIRLRWYGDTHRPDALQLEQKNKSGFLVKKKVASAKNCRLTPQGKLVWPSSDKPPIMTALLPVLANQYQREYWITRDGQVRATIDDQLTSWLADNQKISWRSPTTRVGTILELKYSPQADENIDRIIKYLPFRVSKFSKYVVDVGNLYSSLTRELPYEAID